VLALGTGTLVAIIASAMCLFLVVSGTAKDGRARVILGGVGVAALIVAVALIVDRFV
jgi:hypothetical protein